MIEGLAFDDVLIEPAYSEIGTRSNIDLTQDFLGQKLLIPIISSNMDYVTELEMAAAMWQAGGFYILHRFMDNEKLYDICDYLVLGGYGRNIPISISIGIRDPDEEFDKAEYIASFGGGIKQRMIVTVDVAHGFHKKVEDMVKRLKDADYPYVIAGNVASGDGFHYLAKAGAQAIKVGIGPGSACTTRIVTGVGVPQLTAIQRAVEAQADFPNVKIIADGGIRNSGDIVKSLAAGADAVMLGSLLAGTNEAPGEVRISPDGKRWKPYRGQSIFGVNGEKFVPEGVSGWVEEKGPVVEVLKKLVGGIRSGMSYVGANNIEELRYKAKFIRISHAGLTESQTRIALEI